MRARLRESMTMQELARTYATPHDSGTHDDHAVRVATTIDLAEWQMRRYAGYSVADLSCGDGKITSALHRATQRHLGDYAVGYQYSGRIEDTIHQIPTVNLFVCSETIEHLEDPDVVLAEIRRRTENLVLSTPIGETADVGNPEHYWGWEVDDVEAMLRSAGFKPDALSVLTLFNSTYNFQIWACS